MHKTSDLHGNTIGIVSGKGGVGKTTITANVGVSLVKDFNLNVIVVDANVLTSNLGIHLGFIREPVSLYDVLKNKLKVEQATYVHSSGLSVIPSSLAINETIDCRRLKSIINSLSRVYDFVIVDSAPGLSREALMVLEACDSFIVVTNPELPSVTDCTKTIKVLEEKNKKVIGIVLNKVMGKRYELTKEHIENLTEKHVIAEIPYDDHVPLSIANKEPVVINSPNCSASIRLRQLAGYLCNKPFEVREDWWKRLVRFLFG